MANMACKKNKTKKKSKHNLKLLAIQNNNNLAFSLARLLCCFFPFLHILLDGLVTNQISKIKNDN
jgi:hypothetical protein